jgi:hypothetical protein
MNLQELTRPLTIEDVDFRVQSVNGGGYATILAYKSARIDMTRLDAAVGQLGWQRKHELVDGNLHCHVGIWSGTERGWVWKSDVGTEYMTEKEKGQASDSFKRACFNWGIGRELYDYPVISIKLKENEWTKEGGRPKQTYELKIREWKWLSQFTDGKITFLAAKDQNDQLRFKWGVYNKEQPTQGEGKIEETPEPAVEVKPVSEEGDVKGFLKKETPTPLDEIDGSAEERERAVNEYKAVFGKAPHGRMATDTILNAVQEELMRLKEEVEEESEEEVAQVPEIELTTEEEETPVQEEPLASIKDMYSTIEMFKEPATFIPWAKDIVAAFQDTESAENIKEFQELCNAHYARIKSNK